MEDTDVIANRQLILLGLNIQKYRKLANLTQAELAEKAKLGLSAISRLENANRYTNSETLTILKVAIALNINPQKLFDFKDDM